MIKLSAPSCRWAINHLRKESDTDLFPRPFEIEALSQYQDDVVSLLTSIDIGSYQWVGGRRMVVPKEMVSFRTATQLDPIDALVLAALVRKIGYRLERRRIPTREKIVFSYRFKPSKSGGIYDAGSNWITFWEASLERAKSNGGWVALADVAGYYTQIYHHAVERELQAAGIQQEIVSALIRLLEKLSQGVSRGIPVGPHPIHLLAECVFDPIDKSLLSRRYTFCRYVDDIQIFCKTQEEAYTALFDIADILDKQQRLTLQRHKTEVLPAEEFVERATRITAEAPLDDSEKKIIAVIDRHTRGIRYGKVKLTRLSDADMEILSQHNLEKLLLQYLAQEEPNYARIRWLFRRLAQVGVPGVVQIGISRIKEFIPALAALSRWTE